ncbi:MAG: efflux RND transporter periplasmic adaptor subunit [Calditrichaeota bacterium]|nr:MAG: efflux RND transporter periplasmic adaptor subunit [Calditrichota bacterium]MBL1207028.1 efflux RND transporter periplasmic adaptor subunit [Calditrichota bacterium]NOG46855.1 efflux RND transporter periplasmic adaptor subunit [Calditrichota bacterium]
MKNKILKHKRIIVVMAVVLLATYAFAFFYEGINTTDYVFETTIAEKGTVSNTITATGTLEATNTVVVGTQVSGVIEKIYVDFNSKVKKGQLIAELDKSTLQSSLENAEADLFDAQAELEYQKAGFERNEEFLKKDLLSQSDYDLAKYNYKKSQAGLKSANANLNKAQLNLAYATIYSPIDGLVLNRAVEEGQTVTASMSTPELFTITNDLSEMQVEADIDEADIGMVAEGQKVEFTVDAFPDETFTGKITEVRLQPTESSNVITYTVIVSAQNPELKLKPGMTASITVYIEEVTDALVVAGKALRFTPDREQMAGYFDSLPESERPQRPPRGTQQGAGQAQAPNKDISENIKRVWVKDGSLIKPVEVETGVTDGMNVEIISGLAQGDEVITSMERGGGTDETVAKSEETQSPFVQERPGRPGR